MKKLFFLLISVCLFSSCSTDESVENAAAQNAMIPNGVRIRVGMKFFEPNNQAPGMYMELVPGQYWVDGTKLVIGWGAIEGDDYQEATILLSENDCPDLWLSASKSYGEYRFPSEFASKTDNFYLMNFDMELRDASGNRLNYVLVNPRETIFPDDPVETEFPNGSYSGFLFYFDNIVLKK